MLELQQQNDIEEKAFNWVMRDLCDGPCEKLVRGGSLAFTGPMGARQLQAVRRNIYGRNLRLAALSALLERKVRNTPIQSRTTSLETVPPHTRKLR